MLEEASSQGSGGWGEGLGGTIRIVIVAAGGSAPGLGIFAGIGAKGCDDGGSFVSGRKIRDGRQGELLLVVFDNGRSGKAEVETAVERSGNFWWRRWPFFLVLVRGRLIESEGCCAEIFEAVCEWVVCAIGGFRRAQARGPIGWGRNGSSGHAKLLASLHCAVNGEQMGGDLAVQREEDGGDQCDDISAELE